MKNKLTLELSFVLIILIIGFTVSELYVRIYHKPEIDNEYLAEVRERSHIGPYIQASKDSDLFYELRPSLNAIWLGQGVFTDENGCRIASPKYKENRRAKYKIALIGDSSAFGWGVLYKNTYAEKLKTNLESYFKNKIEIRNYSVPGYNSYQESICIEKKIINWHPNLIILHYDHNDPDPTLTVTSSFLDPEYGDNILKSALYKYLKRKIKIMQNNNLEIFRQDNDQVAFYDNYRIAGPLYEKHKQALLKIRNDCKKGEIKLLILIFDTWIKNDVVFSNKHYLMLHRPLVEFFNNAHINYLDLYPEYQNIMDINEWQDLSPFWLSEKYQDAHPNESGHKFISDHLSKFIISRNILQ
jgi:hypothetical protein